MPVRVIGRCEDSGVKLREWQAILQWNSPGGVEFRLILVEALPEFMAVAARIAEFKHPVPAELALDVEIVFQHIRRPVVGVNREGRGKSRDLIQAWEEVVHEDVRARTAVYQREVGVEGRDQTRELQLVQVDVVIEDAEPGANDCLLSKWAPGQPYARGEVILVRLDDACRDQTLFGIVEAIQRRRDVGRKLVVSDQAGGRI